MNRRITTALLAACLISGICTYLLARRVRLASLAGSQAALQYVVPVRALAPGEMLKATDLTIKRWPVDSPLTGAMTQPAAPVGRVLLYPLEAGQPILERDLAAAGSGGGLASRIPQGMRALALSSDDVVGVAGFLGPGSHVDVLVTYRADNAAGPVTATVLQNAEVLTAGQRVEPDPAGKPASATVVTLLLTPVAAERAVLASTQGRVHFVLRNGLDKAETSGEPISLARLDGGLGLSAQQPSPQPGPFPVPAPAARPAPRPRRRGMETVLGGDSAAGAQQP